MAAVNVISAGRGFSIPDYIQGGIQRIKDNVVERIGHVSGVIGARDTRELVNGLSFFKEISERDFTQMTVAMVGELMEKTEAFVEKKMIGTATVEINLGRKMHPFKHPETNGNHVTSEKFVAPLILWEDDMDKPTQYLFPVTIFSTPSHGTRFVMPLNGRIMILHFHMDTDSAGQCSDFGGREIEEVVADPEAYYSPNDHFALPEGVAGWCSVM